MHPAGADTLLRAERKAIPFMQLRSLAHDDILVSVMKKAIAF